MKIQASGWLIAGVMALGLNGFYHDGGFAWAHRAIAEFEHNTTAVLALASGRADEFLAEVKPVVVHQESASCPIATAFARVQTKVARMQTEFAHTQLAQVAPAQTYQVNLDRLLAAQVVASDRLQEMSDRRQAAIERAQAKQVEVQARIAAKMVRIQSMPALQYASFETHCPQIHVHVPRVHVPEIQIPQVHIPQISVPAIDMGAGPV
jgi:hypothetical protein